MKQLFGEAENYDTPQVDFTTWARSMNIEAFTIRKPGDITPTLMRALAAQKGPALLDIRIDPNVRIRGGGRVEALQQMSKAPESDPRGLN